MFLQGPYFSEEGPWDSPRQNPGENTGKRCNLEQKSVICDNQWFQNGFNMLLKFNIMYM